MNLILDIGNTAIKLALFKGGELVFDETFQQDVLFEKIDNLFIEPWSIDQAIVSSTGELDKKAVTKLSALCDLHVLDCTTKVPFKNLYATPHTLGVDRIALAAAAFSENSSKNTLIIDAGTCITYDILNTNNEYLGGAISPGIQMRYEAMHNQTSKLPLLEKEIPLNLIGNSTETSMHSGVVYGTCAEIDGKSTIINQVLQI